MLLQLWEAAAEVKTRHALLPVQEEGASLLVLGDASSWELPRPAGCYR